MLRLAFALLALQSPGPKQIIQKRYAELNRAMVGMNAAAVSDWLKHYAAKGFFYVSGAGSSYTADQLGALLQKEFNGTQSVKKAEYRFANFAVHGEKASCSVLSHLVVMVSGGHRVEDDTTAIYNWTQVNGSWKVTSIVTTKEEKR